MRFLSPDSIVPLATQGTQALDRYAYANNNPIRYNDPSGHWIETALDIAFIAYDLIQINQEGWTLVNTVALVADVACAVVPLGTGGGPAVRVIASGGDIATAVAVASNAAAKLPEAVRVGQAVEKGIQFIEGANNSQSPFSNLKAGTEVNKGGIDPSKVYFPTKKSGQAVERGWTLDSIMDVVKNPVQTRSNPNITNRATHNPVTYYYRADGYYVVVDDVTGEIVQVSDTRDPGWIDEMTDQPIEPFK